MKITDQKIWEEIAIAYDTPFRKRTSYQKLLTFSGLCHAAAAIHGIKIPRTQKKKLQKLLRIIAIDAQKEGEFFWPIRHNKVFTHVGSFRRDYDRYRATLASFFAALGKKDIQQIIRSMPFREE